MAKPLHVIVACAENRVIGRDHKLPWHIPEDLRFFHDQTAGHICVMGRICFETWPRACQDGRRPIVVTSHPLSIAAKPVGTNRESNTAGPAIQPIPVSSLADALDTAEQLPGDIAICGGERIYAETLAQRDRRLILHLTLIHAEVTGDTYFPEWRHLPWRETARRESDDANWRYTFHEFVYDPV